MKAKSIFDYQTADESNYFLIISTGKITEEMESTKSQLTST